MQNYIDDHLSRSVWDRDKGEKQRNHDKISVTKNVGDEKEGRTQANDCDRVRLSQACIEYVRNDLEKKGDSSTQISVAVELNVSQSMISQVENPDSTKSFRYDVIERYARKQGKSLAQFCLELVPLMTDDDENLKDAEEIPFKSQTILDECFDCFEILNGGLIQKKTTKKCQADLFYKKILRSSFTLLSKHQAQPISVALFFQHGRFDRVFIAQDKDRKKPILERVYTDAQTPRNIEGAIRKCWLSDESSKMVREFTVVRPSIGRVSSTDEFWQDFTKSKPRNVGLKMKVCAAKVHKQINALEHNQTGEYSITMLFVFNNDFLVTKSLRHVMILMSALAKRVHSLEIEANLQSMTRLVGISLLPADVRPHSTFYEVGTGVASSSLEQMEGHVQNFLRIVTHKEGLIAAEVWSYDWTEGKFSRLSPYFQYVNPKFGDRVVLKDGELVSSETVYNEMCKELTPSPYGKTNFILKSRKPLCMDCYTEAERSRIPGIETHMIIGMPMTIVDRHNDRIVHSVLYVRCPAPVASPEQMLVNIATIAEKDCRDIHIFLAPSTARDVTELRDMSFDNLSTNVRMIPKFL